MQQGNFNKLPLFFQCYNVFMSTYGEKGVLRERLLRQRQGLAPEQVMAASREITRRCVDVIEWDKVRFLHSYVQIAARKEVNSWPLLEHVWEHQPQVATAVPIMRGGRIVSVQVDDSTHWQENSLGIPEPTDGIPLDIEQLFDVIIVPVLGFDRWGQRLGYGKGHYDRFLRTQPNALTIGLAYVCLEVEPAIPAEPHDVALKHIITEEEVITT